MKKKLIYINEKFPDIVASEKGEKDEIKKIWANLTQKQKQYISDNKVLQ